MKKIIRSLFTAITVGSLFRSVVAGEPGWKYREEVESIDGWTTVFITKVGKNLNYEGDVILGLLCEKNDTHNTIALDTDWDKTIASPDEWIPVIIRLDKHPLIDVMFWTVLRGETTALDSYRSDPVPFVKEMQTASEIYVRIIFEGTRSDIKYDLPDFAEAARPISKSCTAKKIETSV